MIPWAARYALAAYEHDPKVVLPSWLLMAVQIHLYGDGCAACAQAARARELNEQMT